MDADLLWTTALTAGMGLIGWVLKSAVDEMQRLNILLNKTREEYATRAEMRDDMRQVMEALHRVEDKLDKVLGRG